MNGLTHENHLKKKTEHVNNRKRKKLKQNILCVIEMETEAFVCIHFWFVIMYFFCSQSLWNISPSIQVYMLWKWFKE